MRLENLYLNFGESSPEDQARYISEYRLRRAQDLEKVPTTKKKSSAPKQTRLELTEEEKVVMKMLGLKQKDIIALRSVSVEDDDEVEETGDLFKDATFDEEEED